MAQYTKPIPKNPASCDETLKAVLEAVIFYTEDGDELIGYENNSDKVVLKFEGEG